MLHALYSGHFHGADVTFSGPGAPNSNAGKALDGCSLAAPDYYMTFFSCFFYLVIVFLLILS
jgi:hypothetical protein